MYKLECNLQSSSWEGYLIANQASSGQGTSTSAQDLLRKRYLGISGSNKVVGALEMQQVNDSSVTLPVMLPVCVIFHMHYI